MLVCCRWIVEDVEARWIGYRVWCEQEEQVRGRVSFCSSHELACRSTSSQPRGTSFAKPHATCHHRPSFNLFHLETWPWLALGTFCITQIFHIMISLRFVGLLLSIYSTTSEPNDVMANCSYNVNSSLRAQTMQTWLAGVPCNCRMICIAPF